MMPPGRCSKCPCSMAVRKRILILVDRENPSKLIFCRSRSRTSRVLSDPIDDPLLKSIAAARVRSPLAPIQFCNARGFRARIIADEELGIKLEEILGKTGLNARCQTISTVRENNAPLLPRIFQSQVGE